VSSVGADADSNNFYLAVKGRMEAAVEGIGFESVRIYRPSLMMGKRQESRPAERWGQMGAPLVAPLMRGPFLKYRPVSARLVAAAMATGAREPVAGVHVHTYGEIAALGSSVI
jgi:uncharacterized protein YbjT (DUF2867 family)